MNIFIYLYILYKVYYFGQCLVCLGSLKLLQQNHIEEQKLDNTVNSGISLFF